MGDVKKSRRRREGGKRNRTRVTRSSCTKGGRNVFSAVLSLFKKMGGRRSGSGGTAAFGPQKERNARK